MAVGRDLRHSSPPGISRWLAKAVPKPLRCGAQLGLGVLLKCLVDPGTAPCRSWHRAGVEFSGVEFSGGPGAHIAPLLGRRVVNTLPPSW